MKETPTVEFGKKWDGILIEIEKFKSWCDENNIKDNTGNGYYATLTSKSNIAALPTDFEFGIYRNDFTHIIWFEAK